MYIFEFSSRAPNKLPGWLTTSPLAGVCSFAADFLGNLGVLRDFEGFLGIFRDFGGIYIGGIYFGGILRNFNGIFLIAMGS